MTPRGVSDVNVYTPERVEARYGIPPDADPGLHRAEGRHVRQHPGRPGHRRQDGRAADRPVRLAGGGARPRRRAVAGALASAITEHADQARTVEAARDHAARPRPRVRPGRARARAARPLRAEGDVPPLRVPQPAAARRRARRGGSGAPRGRSSDDADAVARGADASRRTGPVGLAADGDRIARSRHDDVVVVAPRAEPRRGASLRRARREGSAGRGGRRHDARRLPDRARPRRPTSSTTSPPSTASSSRPTPDAEEETAASSAAPAIPLRLIATDARARCASAAPSSSTARSSSRSPRVLAAMEDAGVKIDTYRMGEITARLADRVEELEAKAYELAGEEFMLGSTQQVGADPLREARPDARAARARPATRPTRASCARSATSTRSSP